MLGASLWSSSAKHIFSQSPVQPGELRFSFEALSYWLLIVGKAGPACCRDVDGVRRDGRRAMEVVLACEVVESM